MRKDDIDNNASEPEKISGGDTGLSSLNAAKKHIPEACPWPFETAEQFAIQAGLGDAGAGQTVRAEHTSMDDDQYANLKDFIDCEMRDMLAAACVKRNKLEAETELCAASPVSQLDTVSGLRQGDLAVGESAQGVRSSDAVTPAPAMAENMMKGAVNAGRSPIEVTMPWPAPVDGAILAEGIRVSIESHIVFTSRHDAVLATLWVLGTYFMIGWRLWPRLLITAATKASGKSALLELIHACAFRGLMVSNSSASALFRIIERHAPTLCLDEADLWVKQNREIATILNSGHTKMAAFVARAGRGKGQDDVDFFSTWCPIVIAGIGTQRDTLTSRSIVISLQPRLSTEDVSPLHFDMHAHMADTRRQILKWSEDNLDAVKASPALPPDCGNHRRRDNFRPLWQLADVLGGPWPRLLHEAYFSNMPKKDGDDDGPGVMLLRDVWAVFAAQQTKSAIRTADIIVRLAALEECPWSTWHKGQAITPHQLAKLLKPFGVRSHDRRESEGVAKSYLRDEVEQAYSRFAA